MMNCRGNNTVRRVKDQQNLDTEMSVMTITNQERKKSTKEKLICIHE